MIPPSEMNHIHLFVLFCADLWIPSELVTGLAGAILNMNDSPLSLYFVVYFLSLFCLSPKGQVLTPSRPKSPYTLLHMTDLCGFFLPLACSMFKLSR